MAPTSGNPTIARSRITDTGTARAHDLTVIEGRLHQLLKLPL